VPTNDNALGQEDGLISAAHAAASWARARRATWTSAPLPAVDDSAAAPEGDFVFLAAPPRTTAPVEKPPAPFVAPAMATPPPLGAPVEIRPAPIAAPTIEAPALPYVAPEIPPPVPVADLPSSIDSQPAAAARPAFSLDAPAMRWVVRGAIAAAVVAAVVIGGRSLWSALPARQAPAEAKAKPPASNFISNKPATPPAKPAAANKPGGKAVGSLHVSSTPPGAQVLVDGKTRGVTPLDLADLSPGHHEVALQSDAGSVKRTVTVTANATVTIDEAIFSGFVGVYAPFDVTVTEGGRVLRADDRQQIMLPSGAHDLRIVNRALGFDVVRRVEVGPGETANLQLTPEPSALTVTAAQTTEVWLDGTRLGDTPLTNAPVPLGVHEILVRRAGAGERRYSITVGVKPFTLNVDF
jgi:hypothetical protein